MERLPCVLVLAGVVVTACSQVRVQRPGTGGDGPVATNGGEATAPVLPPMAVTSDLAARATALLDRGLEERGAWEMLKELVRRAPHRLSGSPGYTEAATWAEEAMRAAGLENVRREPVLVPHWERGSVERVVAHLAGGGTRDLVACTLGGSVASPAGGITAPVVEADGLEGLAALDDAAVRGRIVFLSHPMERRVRHTGQAYGRAVPQRSRGAIEAAKKGAVAVVVRSMSTAEDDVPHTGAMHYQEGVPRIPALAIGVQSAVWLSEALARGEVESLTVECDPRTLPDVEQWNVIGELPGSGLPDEYVVVGGHLDCWDKGQGAHDDGGGCCQAIEASRLLKVCGVRPRRTIRVVLFANEENGLRGGRAYAREHAGEVHHFAMESDSGSFAPWGIALNLPEEVVARLRPLGAPLAPVGAERVYRGGGGADIGPLARQGVPVGSLRVDGNRYFDVHHSDNDTIAAVNPREIELGAVVMAWWLAILADLDAADLQGPGD